MGAGRGFGVGAPCGGPRTACVSIINSCVRGEASYSCCASRGPWFRANTTDKIWRAWSGTGRTRPERSTGMGIRAEVPRRIEGQALQASRTAASGRGREGPLTRREGKCL